MRNLFKHPSVDLIKNEFLIQFRIIDEVKLSAQFDHVKKLSDFVGFITRILFLSIIINFVEFSIGHSNWLMKLPLLIFMFFLILFQLYFSAAFGILLSKFVFKFVPSLFTINDHRFAKAERKFLFFSALVMIFFSQVALNVAVGNMADQYLEKGKPDAQTVADQK